VQRLTTQTFFLEPSITPVLFGAPRVVAVQGRLPLSESIPKERFKLDHTIKRESSIKFFPILRARSGCLTFRRPGVLRSAARYLELPGNLDPRIAALAKQVSTSSGARNGYDEARAIETYLRDNYGYTLELRAGGPDPLSDFLFRVRAGHCEYFATGAGGDAEDSRYRLKGGKWFFCRGSITKRRTPTPCAKAMRTRG